MLKIQVRGRTNVIRNINKATKLIERRSNIGIEKVAETCRSFMVNYAPVKTGALKSNIEVWNVSKFAYSNYSFLIVSLVPYSSWVEFGRFGPKEFLPYGKTPGGPDFSQSRYTGNPYMRKALTEIFNSGYSIFLREFNK